MHAIASLCLAALLQGGPWRSLPVPELCTEPSAGTSLPLLVDGRHLELPDEARVAEVEPASVVHLGPSALLALLREDTARRRLALRFDSSVPPLLASGDESALATVHSLLQSLAQQGRDLEIELSAWLLPGAANVGTHPARAVFEAAVDGAARLGSARVRPGGEVQFGTRGAREFVGGYHVQIATGSAVSSPALGRAYVGNTLHLRATRARRGARIALEGVLDLSALLAVDAFDSQTGDFGRIQLPRLAVAQLAFSGNVESGGVLAVTLRGSPLPDPDWTLWIEARSSAGAAGSEAPDRTERDGGAARAPVQWLMRDCALSEFPPRVLPRADLGDLRGGNADERDAPAPLLAPLSSSVVAQGADALRSSSGARGRAPIVWSPGLLLAPVEEKDVWQEMDSMIDAAEDARLDEAALEFHGGKASALLPVAAGASARVLLGVEHAQVVGYESQVAQETWMPRPMVGREFDGIAFDGRWGVGALSGIAVRTESTSAEVLERESVGLARQPLAQRRRAEGRVLLAPGPQATVLEPLGGSAGVALKVTPREH